MAGAARTAFVGRAVVLTELTGLLDEAAAGAGSAALLYGEAGIGKTRTLQELADRAADRGFLVAWGRCTELDGVPPYWPWREVFTTLAVPPPPEPAGRAAVLTGLVDRIDEIAAGRPLVVCAEDLHWADADTRWLLRGLMDATAGRPVLVLASWRTAEVADELAGLPPRVHRLPLRPLATEDSVALARQVADGGLPDEALTRAARQAGGNPFFVRELVRMQLLGAVGAERIPRGVREVVARRLARLPSAVVATLTAAAALGGDADLAVLATTTAAEPAAVRLALEAAVQAGLVEPLGDRGPVEFVHAVVREVLLDEAGPDGRAALHERVARALETGRPGAEAALATHWAQVPGPDAAAHAARHARHARDAARAAGALDQAVTFAALAAEGGGDPEDLLLLGDSRARTGDMDAARADLLRAVAAARQRGRIDLLARATLALAGGEGGFEVAMTDAVQLELLDEAARALPTGGLRARVRARQAVAGSLSAPLAERLALARAAVAEAGQAADAGALLHALAAYADMIGAPRHLAERRAVADRMLDLARGQGDVNGELLARRFRLVALLETGEFAAADAEIDAFDRLAQRTHEPAHLWYPPLWRGMRALLAGREADAEAAADRVDVLGARAHSGNALVLAWTLRLATRSGRPDDLAEVRGTFEEYANDFPPDQPQILLTRAWVATALRDRAEAIRGYRPLADAGFATVPEDAEYLGNLLGCTEAALFLGDRPGAELLHRSLAPYAERWIVDGIGAACWGVVAEWLGRLDALLGRPAAAARWRADAERAYVASGASGPLRRLSGDTGRPGLRQGRLRREPGGWRVDWDGRPAVLPDLKGLHDLAMLLSRPGTPVPAVRLLAAGAGVEMPTLGRGDEVLDERARAAYRDRLRVLEDDLADAEAAADLGSAQRIRDEREFLLRELSAALGMGGRPRRLGDDTDRARKAVTMRLRDAIARLDGPMPGLAEHLRAAVRTGRECCYAPDEPVSWRVSTRSAAD